MFQEVCLELAGLLLEFFYKIDFPRKIYVEMDITTQKQIIDFQHFLIQFVSSQLENDTTTNNIQLTKKLVNVFASRFRMKTFINANILKHWRKMMYSVRDPLYQIINETGTSKVGAISKAQKAQL